MSNDNVIKSSDVNKTKEDQTSKTTAKKASTRKAAAPKKDSESIIAIPEDGVLVIFESGASYSSGEVRFTRDNPIQKVSPELAEFLLQLDNFRRPDALELEEYLNSRED